MTASRRVIIAADDDARGADQARRILGTPLLGALAIGRECEAQRAPGVATLFPLTDPKRVAGRDRPPDFVQPVDDTTDAFDARFPAPRCPARLRKALAAVRKVPTLDPRKWSTSLVAISPRAARH